MSEQKRLLRAHDGRMLGGVCAGLAVYLGIDVVFVRLAFILLALNGIGVGVYLILWILIPDDEHRELTSEAAVKANVQDIGERARSLVGTDRGALWAGLALVVVGVVLLGNRFVPAINFGLVWPALLIALGAYLLIRRQ